MGPGSGRRCVGAWRGVGARLLVHVGHQGARAAVLADELRLMGAEVAVAVADLAVPARAWTNGQVERMNRTIKDAIVKRFYDQDHDRLRRHLDDVVSAYDFARRLKTIRGLTPYEFICKSWTTEPERFTLNPLQQMPRLNIKPPGR